MAVAGTDGESGWEDDGWGGDDWGAIDSKPADQVSADHMWLLRSTCPERRLLLSNSRNQLELFESKLLSVGVRASYDPRLLLVRHVPQGRGASLVDSAFSFGPSD